MKWKTERFGDVCTFVRGPFGGSLKKNIFKEDGYAVYEQQHAIYDQFTDIRYFVDEEKFLEMSRFELFAGDLIMSCSGTMGKIAIVPSGIPRGIINQALLKLTPKGDLSPKFLKLWMESRNFQEQIEFLSQGAAIKNMASVKILKEIRVPTPSLEEQKRIVAILDQVFADIEKARATAETNLKNARELFDSYLQQVFSARNEGWVETELFEHVKFIDYRGKTPKKTDQGLRLITAKNVRMGYLKTEPQEFVAPDSYDDWMTRGIPKKGDVLFTTEAPLANVAQLDTDEKTVFAQRIITMQPDSNIINSTFLKYMLMSQPVQKRIHDKGTGATCTGIKASLLKKILITYPANIKKQREYVEVLDSLTNNVKLLESVYLQKLCALDELKKSILQKAFTGELTKSKGIAA
jgi:type I restriction enzyme S subunit